MRSSQTSQMDPSGIRPTSTYVLVSLAAIMAALVKMHENQAVAVVAADARAICPVSYLSSSSSRYLEIC